MNNPDRMRRRDFLALTAAFGVWPSLNPAGHLVAARDAHLEARPAGAPSSSVVAGERALGMGDDRDGFLYVPRGYDPNRPAPLAVMLHGAGRRAQNMNWGYPLADELGVIILAPDSRGQTWDAIRGQTGPDVDFIDAALKSVFASLRVDPRRLALGGFSDGASYALSLGFANGDLFTHVMALSPGFIPDNPRRGKPRVFISHGTEDRVLPINATSRVIAPELKAEGYDLAYREFEGPHRVLPEISRAAFEWFTK